MLHVLNEYATLKDTPEVTALTIRSAKQGDTTFYVDTRFADALKQMRWCYEQEKAQVYHTDVKRSIVPKLGVAGTRLYLWKYILWLDTGKVPLFWHRTKYDSYLVGQGICDFVTAK